MRLEINKLSELADYFDDRAAAEMNGPTPRLRGTRAAVWRDAANLVRKTTITTEPKPRKRKERN